MSTEQKPRRVRRSFKYIIRFFQIIFAMIFVFLASFFVTLALRTEPPDDAVEISEKVSANEKVSAPVKKKFSDSEEASFGEKIDRIFDIEAAVNAKARNIRHYVLLKDIPRSLRQAVIAVEDARFYSHKGFDVESIARAAIVNVEAGQIEEGASTITQQLVKNLFLSQERSFTRKAEELLLAMNVERHFEKDKIIELYLNTIYFGSNFYGIYDASYGYFGKPPKDLTLAESAMLAGLPNAPSLYSPYVNFMLAKKRQLVVIDAMVRAHLLTNYEAEKARIEEIILKDGYY